MPNYDILASHESTILGVHRSTLIDAIRGGRCGGEERGGHWYTSEAATAKWYAEHYRHAGTVYSQTSGKGWTDQEPELLRLAGEGATVEEMAVALKRSVAAVKTKLSKLRATDAVPPARRGRPPKAEPPTTKQAPPQPSFLPGPSPEQIAAARRLVAEDDARRGGGDPYRQRRKDDQKGRQRIHLAPVVRESLYSGLSKINAGRSRDQEISLAQFLGWAGLAALENHEIIKRGRELSSKLGR